MAEDKGKKGEGKPFGAEIPRLDSEDAAHVARRAAARVEELYRWLVIYERRLIALEGRGELQKSAPLPIGAASRDLPTIDSVNVALKLPHVLRGKVDALERWREEVGRRFDLVMEALEEVREMIGQRDAAVTEARDVTQRDADFVTDRDGVTAPKSDAERARAYRERKRQEEENG
jgi:hypothetical protein